MDAVLQLCDTCDSKYPDHFQMFLDNCLERHKSSFVSNDYLFAAVYFIVLECGFCPVYLQDEFPQLCTDCFNIRKLRYIQSYSSDCMKLVKTKTTEYWVYGIPLELGNYRWECQLQGVPSVENNSYLIVNLLTRTLGVVKSVCLSTENYIVKDGSPSKHSFKLKNLDELALLIKNKLSNSIKEMIMLNTGQGCCPNLLRLPEDVQKKIIYFLVPNAADVQNLASTCTYFYNVITNDLKLWEILSFSEFDEKSLNEALEDIMERPLDDDLNIFRKVFLNLKMKKLNKPYRCTGTNRHGFLML